MFKNFNNMLFNKKPRLMGYQIEFYVHTIKNCKNINSIIEILKKIENNDVTLYDMIIIYQQYKKQNECKIFKNKNISNLINNIDDWCNNNLYLEGGEDYFEDYPHTLKIKYVIFQKS